MGDHASFVERVVATFLGTVLALTVVGALAAYLLREQVQEAKAYLDDLTSGGGATAGLLGGIGGDLIGDVLGGGLGSPEEMFGEPDDDWRVDFDGGDDEDE